MGIQVHSTLRWTPEGAFILYILYYPDPSPFLSASTNEGPCASFSNTARMPLIFLMGIYVKKKIYGPPRTRRRRKNKDLFLVVVLVIEMWPLLYCFIYCHSQWSWQTQVDELDFDNNRQWFSFVYMTLMPDWCWLTCLFASTHTWYKLVIAHNLKCG